jgi:hypothetical protein
MDWRALITTTIQLYQQTVNETWKRLQQHWWVAFLPFVYGVVFLVASIIAAPLGILGGFLLGFVLALCTSSYLYYIAGVVDGNRMTLADLGESWRPYLSPVMTILFFFFVVQYTLAMLLPPTSGGVLVHLLINLVLLIALNPIPEIIYQGRSDGFDMLQESVDFLRESGIEWFTPLLLLALVSYFVPLPLLSLVFQSGTLMFPSFGGGALFGSLTGLLWAAISALLFYVLMVFRGLLFRALSGSTRRQRLFRARFS